MADLNSLLPPDMLKWPGSIIGTTGSGKTVLSHLFAAMINQADRPLPFSMIDPMGVGWGLKLSADGKQRGLENIALAGVPHAGTRKPQPDIPITSDGGARLAELIVKHRMSVILDLSGFEDDADYGMPGVRDAMESEDYQQKFSGDFHRALYQANSLPHHHFVDEAHKLAKQRPNKDQPYAMYSRRMLERIAKEGRSKGIRPCYITQRPTDVSKDVLNMSAWVVLMRTSENEIGSVEKYVGSTASATQKKHALSNVPQLSPGEAYVSFPMAGVFKRMQFPMSQTFNSSKTPDEEDIDVEIATDIASLDLSAIAEALMPKTASEEAAERGYVLKEDHDRLVAEARSAGREAGRVTGEKIGRSRGFVEGQEEAKALMRAVLDGRNVVELRSINVEPEGEKS